MNGLNKKKLILKKNKKLVLKILQVKDVSSSYVRWLNNKEIVKYTEQRHFKHNSRSVKKFVSEKYKSNKDFLFGIYYKNKHVGNIKLGPLNERQKKSDISYIIGYKKFWNKGIASKSIDLISEFAFKTLKLKILRAGAYLENPGSIKVLKKNGYSFSRYSQIKKKKTMILVKKKNYLRSSKG